MRILPRPAAPTRHTGPRRSWRTWGERAFRVDASGFWQVHRLAASSLWQTLAARLRGLPGGPDDGAHHLDLYGGVGLFAALLGDWAGRSARITTVEADAAATERAGENLAEWIGARAETGRVDRWLAQWERTAGAAQRDRVARGVIVLDPPRAGRGPAGRRVDHATAARRRGVCRVRPGRACARCRDLPRRRLRARLRRCPRPLPELASPRGDRDPPARGTRGGYPASHPRPHPPIASSP